MNRIVRSSEFDSWLRELRDLNARVRIVCRLEAAERGNFGDCRPIMEGLSEMRIHCGPGYRVYYTRRGGDVYAMLAGGNKSTQQRDIAKALKMLREMEMED